LKKINKYEPQNNESNLVDIESIFIDTDLPKEHRLNEYVKKIKNPYVFRCNNVKVKIKFSENNTKSIEDILTKIIASG
jgi:hypothetical protein